MIILHSIRSNKMRIMKSLLFILIMPLMVLCQNPDMTTERGRLLMGIKMNHVSIFMNKYYDAAEELWLCDSIPMAISLSQWALESGYGRYQPALDNNNIGGLYMRDSSGKHRLIKFKSMESFYRCYVRTLKKSCYKNLQPQTNEEWIKALKCCVYATSKNYGKDLRWIIKKFGLKDLGKGINWKLKEKRVGYYCKKNDKRYCNDCAFERRRKKMRELEEKGLKIQLWGIREDLY